MTVVADALSFEAGAARASSRGFARAVVGPSAGGVPETPAVTLRLRGDGGEVRLEGVER